MKILKILSGEKQKNLENWLTSQVIPDNPTRREIKEFREKMQQIEGLQKNRQMKIEDKRKKIASMKSSIPSLEQKLAEQEEHLKKILDEWEEREKEFQVQIRSLKRKRKLFWAGGVLLAGVIVFLVISTMSGRLEELEEVRVSTIETIKTVDLPKAKEELEKAVKEHQKELNVLETERQEVQDKQESLQKEYESLISIEN